MNILETFDQNAQLYPHELAVEFLDPPLQRQTYAELAQSVKQTAGFLQSIGVCPGDRVALQLSKSLEFILLHLATLRLGAISLPLNPAYPPDEIGYFLADSGARFFFALKAQEAGLRPVISRLPDLQSALFLDPAVPGDFPSLIQVHLSNHLDSHPTDLSDTAVIIYTSGTTGRPKGAEITHGNLNANLAALRQAWAWSPDDVLLHVLPLFHVHGLFVALHAALYAGATTLLTREFDAHNVLERLANDRCTVFMAVPTIHQRLLDLPNSGSFDISHLRLVTSGSDRLPDEVFKGFQVTFGQTLVERYGLTETGMLCSNPLSGERRMGTVGLPLPGVEVRVAVAETGEVLPIGEVGEVQVRGANIFKGYWQRPRQTTEAFTPDGWFRTGDLGSLDPDGYLTLRGRSKDLIISGGLNVYPPEVERVLAQHPAVAACAVIGCPDRDWGERVTAVVVPTEPGIISEAELIVFCRAQLAPYKIPKTILFRTELPRNAMGKVQKIELRRDLCRPGS